jgi:hypothetical protein
MHASTNRPPSIRIVDATPICMPFLTHARCIPHAGSAFTMRPPPQAGVHGPTMTRARSRPEPHPPRHRQVPHFPFAWRMLGRRGCWLLRFVDDPCCWHTNRRRRWRPRRQARTVCCPIELAAAMHTAPNGPRSRSAPCTNSTGTWAGKRMCCTEALQSQTPDQKTLRIPSRKRCAG